MSASNCFVKPFFWGEANIGASAVRVESQGLNTAELEEETTKFIFCYIPGQIWDSSLKIWGWLMFLLNCSSEEMWVSGSTTNLRVHFSGETQRLKIGDSCISRLGKSHHQRFSIYLLFFNDFMLRFLFILSAWLQSVKNCDSLNLCDWDSLILWDPTQNAMLLDQMVEVESDLRIAFFLSQQKCINDTFCLWLDLCQWLFQLWQFLHNRSDLLLNERSEVILLLLTDSDYLPPCVLSLLNRSTSSSQHIWIIII